MKTCSIILLVTLLLPGPAFSQDKLLFPTINTDSIAAAYLKKSSGSAIVIGLFDSGKETIYYYGKISKTSTGSPDANSIFELGNITETFTSILLADLNIKGTISMDDPVQKHMPPGVLIPVFQNIVCEPVRISPQGPAGDVGREIKFTPYVCYPDPKDRPRQLLLCDLATHTTGLPEYPWNLPRKTSTADGYSLYNEKQLHKYLNGLNTLDPAGFIYRHSSLGSVLLGHALSVKMKKSFDSLMTESVIKKLQLSGTTYTPGQDQQKKMTQGYSSKGKEVNNHIYTTWAPASGLYTTPADFMKFLKANLGFCDKEMKDALDYTHNSRLLVSSEKSLYQEIGLNWYITSLGDSGKKITWNSSNSEGYSAYIGFIETEKKGVFILSNSPLDLSETGIMMIKKMFLGRSGL